MRAAFLAFVLLLSGCASDEWNETRKENIERVKASCAAEGGRITITYTVGSFSSSISVTCTYPQQTDPAIRLDPQ